MMKISLITTLATLLLLFTSFSIATGERTSQIIVYKAKKIPKIDGKIESSEWDDAQPYYFEKKTNKYILNGRFKMTIALKHDSENLYILVIANDDDYDDGDFVFFNIHYHPQVNLSWSWDTTFLLYAGNRVTNGTMTKCGVFPSNRIDAQIKASYHRYIAGNYYIFEVAIPIKYIPINAYEIEVGYHDAHYEWKIRYGLVTYFELEYEFYVGKFSMSQNYYEGNETVENIIEEHYPTGNYFYFVALGVAAVAIIASIIAIMRRRRRE